MSTLLFIQASPNGEESYSISAAQSFISEYLKHNPSLKMKIINLFDEKIPAYDKNAVEGRMALRKDELSHPAAMAWKQIETICQEFMDASVYVFAVPMWNFGIPYALKQYIDNIFQPGMTFGSDPEKGLVGLMHGKKAFVAYARGSAYAGTPAQPMDHQTSYFDFILNFLSFDKVEKVIVEPCRAKGREAAAEALAKARKEAAEIATRF